MVSFSLLYESNCLENQLRSLLIIDQNTIITGTTDGNLLLISDTNTEFQLTTKLKISNESVYVLGFVGENIAAGCGDGAVRFYTKDLNFIFELPRQAYQVSSLAYRATDNTLFVGHWDGNTLEWSLSGPGCVPTLRSKHASGRYSVTLAVDKNSDHRKQWFSASQDGIIRAHVGECLTAEKKAHSDIVRNLILHNNSIISCSNDSKIYRWKFNSNGEFDESVVPEVLGVATSFCFCVIPITDNAVAVGCENGDLLIWKDGKMQQRVLHPNSIWNIATSGSSLYSICCDGKIRKFEVKESVGSDILIPSKKTKDDELLKWPKSELATRRGAQEGEIELFEENGIVEAYEWKSGKWISIGVVKSNKSSYSGSTLFSAGDYDYIFTVDIEGKNRQLPANRSDDFYEVATKFCKQENIPSFNINDIVTFLKQNIDSGNTFDLQKVLKEYDECGIDIASRALKTLAVPESTEKMLNFVKQKQEQYKMDEGDIHLLSEVLNSILKGDIKSLKPIHQNLILEKIVTYCEMYFVMDIWRLLIGISSPAWLHSKIEEILIIAISSLSEQESRCHVTALRLLYNTAINRSFYTYLNRLDVIENVVPLLNSGKPNIENLAGKTIQAILATCWLNNFSIIEVDKIIDIIKRIPANPFVWHGIAALIIGQVSTVEVEKLQILVSIFSATVPTGLDEWHKQIMVILKSHEITKDMCK